jgi:hypothetical protein
VAILIIRQRFAASGAAPQKPFKLRSNTNIRRITVDLSEEEKAVIYFVWLAVLTNSQRFTVRPDS